MAQRPQIVDITKSYLPGDPNAVVQNLVNTDREDGEEKTIPLIPFEGYNFLPTSYGYKSFFGTNSELGLDTITSRVQYVLNFQLPTYKSRFIALAEDGIWVGLAEGTDTRWIQLVTHTFDPDVYEEWTWCIIENILYMYKQGGANVYKTGSGILTVPLVPAIPAVPGGIVAAPTTFQTFTFVEGNTGAGTDILDSIYYEISVQYKNGTDFSQAGLIDSFTTVNPTPSFDISVTGSAPLSLTEVRIIIYDEDMGSSVYKDYLLSAFPISITDYTGFVAGGAQVGNMDDGTGTPEVPEIPAYDLTNDLTITGFAPSFLNMAGQMGIFKAGLRLGFWDSANSVSWSSNVDLADFTPSLENLAGNRIFGYVVGRIVTIKSHGEGFIIYSTKSIVGVTFSPNSNLIWDGKKVFDNSGISHSHAVITGKSDADHFVYGINNIYAIGKFNALLGKYEGEVILPEIYDFLKESRDPVYLSILQDRYLCFSLISPDYIYGKQSFYENFVNPYEFVVDWYTPSETYPTASTALLPEQLWEIIRQEMSGTSPTKRRDGEWVPLYTTTVDIMDDRHYSFWRQYIGEQSTRLSYDVNSAYLNTVPIDLTLEDMEDFLNAQRPASPPDSSRFGKLRTSTGIRAFSGLMGEGIHTNNEALIYGQESEWDAYIRHAIANKEKLENTVDTRLTVETSLIAIATTIETSVLGSYITGEGNNQWLITEGPSEKAAKEIILRRTFNKAFRITKRVTTVHNLSNLGDYYTFLSSAILSSVAFGGNVLAVNPPGSDSGGTTYRLTVNSQTVDVGSVSLVGNNEDYIATYANGIPASDVIDYYNSLGASLPSKPVSSYSLGFTGTVHVWKDGPDYFASGSGVWDIIQYPLLEGNKEETFEYFITEITGSYGYSQFRALVTRWDRVKFGLYGNYEILESVPAEAMTAKIWEGTYPADQGANRNQIWTYSDYKAVRLPDLANGTIGPFNYAGTDPDGTATVEDANFPSTGIQSVHDSYTLPGASFLLQTGSIEAVYPTFTGALVYDLSLKKWGKYKGDHKLLVEVTPVNSAAFGTISFSDLGVNAGILDAAGSIYLFDSVPLDSWIRYGKLGYYRLGMTNLLEVRASMRYPSDFTISTASSMDGKILDMSTATYHPYYDEVIAEALPDVSARWHVVTISGNYDLTGLEIRATIAGRR